MAVIHFLLVYDPGQHKLIETREYRSADEATVAYSALEAIHRGDSNLEIVLIGADSIETVMQTHGQYFAAEPRAVDRYLVDVS